MPQETRLMANLRGIDDQRLRRSVWRSAVRKTFSIKLAAIQAITTGIGAGGTILVCQLLGMTRWQQLALMCVGVTTITILFALLLHRKRHYAMMEQILAESGQRCLACGYDIHASEGGACPKCGAPVHTRDS